ncbi:uncharacterized protein LOC124911904 [Impatiens glandulifera]|uniref:uncharacterized protein LOC124911904 n=1 Tax=Impatiens glandulifera TaxID=253017 RepID=UPI001FB09BED|nr:uncharacterized protein LOC124911904 [Impatiens glandulifera]
MAESNPRKDDNIKSPNIFERTKEAIESISHKQQKSPTYQNKETHGLRDDIDESTQINDVKAPNVFERAKEEIDAIVQAIHTKKECKNHHHEAKRSDTESVSHSHGSRDEKVSKPHHHKETHGLSNDIDENTNVDEVKGPNVFERAKEEIEAIVQAIHSKKKT